MLTAEEIYKSILFRAGDVYEVDYEYNDIERDVGHQFDPIVRFMAGALASELETVYQEMNESEGRIQHRLAKVLLPEYMFLPTPAHALARARTTSDPIIADETVAFEIVDEEDEEEAPGVAFSPVFPMKILPADIKVLATEYEIIDRGRRSAHRRAIKSEETQEVQQILLGIELDHTIEDWAGASLYFELRDIPEDEHANVLFYSALVEARCTLQGQPIRTSPGLESRELLVEDYLNGNQRLQERIRARYDRHYLTIQSDEVFLGDPISVEHKLIDWFNIKDTDDDDDEAVSLKRLSQGMSIDLNKNLYWFEVKLSQPITIRNASSRLRIEINAFPVVNRRLNGKASGEHYYLRNNSIKWIHLTPAEDFLSIRKVYGIKPPNNPVFTFKPFADFKEDRSPSYTLRHGGIGRWDEYNTWARFSYLVRILSENYKQRELLDQTSGSLTLEELHHLLGERIDTLQERSPSKDIYVLLHAGIDTNMRVIVEYWTSIGERANNLPIKSTMKCLSKHKTSFDSASLVLLTSPQEGKAGLSRTEQLSAMKHVLLTRERIVTREDVKSFCQNHLREDVLKVVVKDGVGSDPRYDFGLTRVLKVTLYPAPSSKSKDWDGIVTELGNLLENKSTLSIPIQVNYEA